MVSKSLHYLANQFHHCSRTQKHMPSSSSDQEDFTPIDHSASSTRFFVFWSVRSSYRLPYHYLRRQLWGTRCVFPTHSKYFAFRQANITLHDWTGSSFSISNYLRIISSPSVFWCNYFLRFHPNPLRRSHQLNIWIAYLLLLLNFSPLHAN